MKDVVPVEKIENVYYTRPKKPKQTTYNSGRRWRMLVITEVFITIDWEKKISFIFWI